MRIPWVVNARILCITHYLVNLNFKKNEIEFFGFILDFWRETLRVHKMNSWIVGFVVCEFDDIEGQKIAETFPSSLKTNLEDIKCHAFPESTTGSRFPDDVVYSFRVRHEKGFHNATACFECRRDKQKARGCTQRSLVLLSRYPFFALFRNILVEHIAPSFFRNGVPTLEAAYEAISSWPDLNKTKDKILSLPLFGSVMTFHIPKRRHHENEIDDVSLYVLVGDTVRIFFWISHSHLFNRIDIRPTYMH